jgi:dipeptidyl aminopeptidase/acylaminoacyl peptidase
MSVDQQTKIIASYGSWKSPITSDLIVAGAVGLSSISLDGEDLYWIELRPSERGRCVLVRRTPDGRVADVTPAPFNVRTRVHEYGGGSYVVDSGEVYFSNFSEQHLYRGRIGAAPEIVASTNALRYADAVLDRTRRRLICVGEDHSDPEREAVNGILSVPVDGSGEPVFLASDRDFYSSPRISPDGRNLCYLAWDHPNMPWDGADLIMASIAENGELENERIIVAGGEVESVFQPQWSPDGVLYFVSDRSGWWNLYRWRNDAIEALCPMEAEFGLPYWVFGLSTYSFASADTIVCTYIEKGYSKLAIFDVAERKLETIETPYSYLEDVTAAPGRAVFLAASPTDSSCIVEFDLSARELKTLRRSSDVRIDPQYLSVPEAIEFPTENGLTAHGFFYPPANREYAGPAAERPPLLVKIHGGPTSATFATLRLGIQYWTSRGVAVLDVNYGGSTGYGREYRDRLKGTWGVVDVDDCVNGASFLAERGSVDADRLAITGGSAGGYTVLCALCFRDVFKAGASHYGVSDLIALDEDTHKFESQYTFSLVGRSRELYIARSPIHHTEKLNAPVIFFQGLEDKVVPPNQSEKMVDALRAKGLPVAYVAFEGEQHGFRQAANIKRALDGELYFYSRIFGFELAEAVDPVPIENL